MTVNGRVPPWVLRSVAVLVASVLHVAPASATCFDGVRDGPESDIDCGGDCPPCERGDWCRGPRDCYSGRCAMQICEERIREPGEDVPAGYHVETSVADSAATARTIGWVSLGIGYGSAYIAALSQPGDVSWLYLPVFGPWIEVADSDQSMRGLLAMNGFLQTVGAGLVIGGVAWSGRQLVRDDAILAHFIITPSVIGKDGMGFWASGAF